MKQGAMCINCRGIRLIAVLVAFALCMLPCLVFAQDEEEEDDFDLDSLGSYEPAAPSQSATDDALLGGPATIFSGKILTKAAQDLQKNNNREFLFSDLTIATAKAAVTLNPTVAVTLQGLMEYEYEANQDETQGTFEAYLWEANARWRLGPVDLTLGQQHVTWGIADTAKPTDIVNANNYRRFLDAELGYNKLPAPMARLEWYLPKKVKVDAVVLPFFVPAKIDIVERDISLFSNQFPLYMVLNNLRENPQFRYAERALDYWYPTWEQDLQNIVDDQDFWDVRTDYLEDDFTHAEGAIRISGRMTNFDWALAYYYLWDDLPTFHLNPEFVDLFTQFQRTEEGYIPIPQPGELDITPATEPFTLMYHRNHAVGGNLGTSWEGIGIRGEALYHFGRYTYTEDFRTRRKPMLLWTANIDYLFSGNLYLSASFFQDAMMDYQPEMMMPNRYDVAILLLRKPWLDERLTTEFAMFYDFSYMSEKKWHRGDWFGEDGVIAPMVTYAITDPLKIKAGANFVFGESYHLFGFLRDDSRGFLQLSFDF